MHELPRDLNNSLRSWRGSTSGRNSRRRNDPDLEKGLPGDYGEESYDEEQLSPAQSSIILHPSASTGSLRQMQRYGRLHQHEEEEDEDEDEDDQHRQQQQQQHRNSARQQQGQKFKSSQKGVTKTQTTTHTQTPNKQSIFAHVPNVRDPDPAASRLDDSDKPLTEDQFYELIGMNRPLPNGELPKELARPRGLYAKIRKQHEYIQTKYRVFDIFTYIFLSVQLLLSAVFIVLGSIRSDYHIAIAVLGAVSAIVAGALSLMKGQGLPNRLRQVRDDLRNVVFEADELYWDVAAGKNVLFSDIKKLREDYLRVLEEARRNHPDSWTSAASSIAQGHKSTSKVKIPKV